MSLTAYIRYDSQGRIVPGGPIVTKTKPTVGNWQVVSQGTSATLVGQLRAFVKLDRYNKPLAGSLFLGKSKPATGKWIQVNAEYQGTTVTTTTSGGGGVTPTAWITYIAGNQESACAQTGGWTFILYTAESSLGAGVILYTDAALTTQFNAYQYGPVLFNNGFIYQLNSMVPNNGTILSVIGSCPTTTTTTTSSVQSTYIYRNDSAAVLSYRNYDINPNVYYLYNAYSGYPVYYQGSIGIGTQFFYDQALTQSVGAWAGATFLSTGGASEVPGNLVFYQLNSTGTIVNELGTAANLAWNQFTASRVQNDLVPCNQMYGNGFALPAGTTSVQVGTTVYNGFNNPFSGWNYLSYNGTVNVLNGGSVVISQQACS